MENIISITELLNDLIKINNDRIVGYEKAIENTKGLDIDLKAVYQDMANQSKKIVNDLGNEVIRHGATVETNTTLAGKVYRVWMDVKATFSGHDRVSSLDACEFGEDTAQKAYKMALESDAEMTADIRKMIMDQQSSLKNSHEIIKKYGEINMAIH
jgi:uncharacterized protein (TIGR02284 family)